jgi:hypothetical protein
MPRWLAESYVNTLANWRIQLPGKGDFCAEIRMYRFVTKLLQAAIVNALIWGMHYGGSCG